jgi:hypothetical protein
MLKRIKQFFESVAYAGLKPTGGKSLAPAPPKKTGWFAPIQERFEKLLSGSGPVDPLYLSNRTFMQKARLWLIIGIPSCFLLGLLGLVLIGFFDPGTTAAPPPAGMSDAEVAQKMLPDLNKDLHVDIQKDVDIQDVHVIHEGGPKLAGIALNNTDHIIPKVDVVFELTDKDGSRQGAVSTTLSDLPAKSSVPFQFAIDQDVAAFALVREVHLR